MVKRTINLVNSHVGCLIKKNSICGNKEEKRKRSRGKSASRSYQQLVLVTRLLYYSL